MKWFITATLMQTTSVPPGSTTQQLSSRGVFIAQGAWWDNVRDGMKSFDLWSDKSYGGVDVTVCIAWITS